MACVAPATGADASFAQDFFRAALEEDPANAFCCDSGAADSAWASVSHGIYLSIGAAGVHRSLGVRVSFVRSTFMDVWPQTHLRMMELGGNRRFREFLEEHGVDEDMPIREKYRTRAAEWYRQNLRALAEGMAPPTPLAPGTGHLAVGSPTLPGVAPSNHEGQAMLDRVFAEAPEGQTPASCFDISPNTRAGVVALSPTPRGACKRLCGTLGYILRCSSRSLLSEEDMMEKDPFVEDELSDQAAVGSYPPSPEPEAISSGSGRRPSKGPVPSVPKLVTAPADVSSEDLGFGAVSLSGSEGACNGGVIATRRRPPLRPCNEGARRQLGYAGRGPSRH